MTEWIDEQPYPDSGIVYSVGILPSPTEADSTAKVSYVDVTWDPAIRDSVARRLRTGCCYVFDYKRSTTSSLQEYVGQKTFWKEPGKVRYTFRAVRSSYDDIRFDDLTEVIMKESGR